MARTHYRLSDLGTLIRSRPYLWVPCARCGRSVSYYDAVATHFGDLHVGFAHPAGDCRTHDIEQFDRLTEKRIAEVPSDR